MSIYSLGFFFFFFLILYIWVEFGLGMPKTRTRFRFFNENPDPTLMLNGSGRAEYPQVGFILPSLPPLLFDGKYYAFWKVLIRAVLYSPDDTIWASFKPK